MNLMHGWYSLVVTQPSTSHCVIVIWSCYSYSWSDTNHMWPLKRLVTALVLSRLDYCNAVLAGLPESTIRSLQRVQNAAARLHQAKWPYHSSSDALTLVADKITNSLQTVPPDAPQSHQPATCPHVRDGSTHCTIFVAVWPPVCQSPPVPEANAENQVLWTSLQSYAGPATWNSLPDYIQSESNTKNVKKLLKTYHRLFSSFIVFRDMKCPGSIL